MALLSVLQHVHGYLLYEGQVGITLTESIRLLLLFLKPVSVQFITSRLFTQMSKCTYVISLPTLTALWNLLLQKSLSPCYLLFLCVYHLPPSPDVFLCSEPFLPAKQGPLFSSESSFPSPSPSSLSLLFWWPPGDLL